MPTIKMCSGKIRISFSGNLSTKEVAQLTSLFSRYRVNIVDINMFTLREELCNLQIICQSSSTTDETDSFWNDIFELTQPLGITYNKQYI
ncbi:MAG: hypothetical protein AB1782_08285 [Cyanobacteriota bacterium]